MECCKLYRCECVRVESAEIVFISLRGQEHEFSWNSRWIDPGGPWRYQEINEEDRP